MERLAPEEFEQLRQELETRYGEKVSDRRVKAIRVNSSYHWQPPLYIEAGKRCANLTQNGSPEDVVVIFESKSFLICTPGNGYKTGRPHIVWRGDVKEVVYEV